MSWEQLITISKEARDMRAEDKAKPIVECPICGELLAVKGDVLNCPWGHYRQTGTARGPESY